MVRAAAEIPEVEAESEVGDDHAAKAHGIENYGPHGTLVFVGVGGLFKVRNV